MRVYVPVPETYAADLKDGMKATLELPEYPDRKFDATIATTSHAIDKKSRSLLVELLADNKDGALAPGAFARVHFRMPPDPNTLRIPASAILFRGDAPQVAAIGLDNRIALKKVHIVRDLGSEVEITGGLTNDKRIVANPPDSIGDGEEVRVMRAAGEKTQASPGQQAEQGAGDHPRSAEEGRKQAAQLLVYEPLEVRSSMWKFLSTRTAVFNTFNVQRHSPRLRHTGRYGPRRRARSARPPLRSENCCDGPASATHLEVPMRALVKKKPEPGLWLEEQPVPEIGPDDVLVKVHKTGICGTDIHIFNWDEWAQKTIPTPMTVGHEYSGGSPNSAQMFDVSRSASVCPARAM